MRRGDESLLAGDGCERKQTLAQSESEGLGIALDEPLVGEDLQRPRDLALLAADDLGDPNHAELVATFIIATEVVIQATSQWRSI